MFKFLRGRSLEQRPLRFIFDSRPTIQVPRNKAECRKPRYLVYLNIYTTSKVASETFLKKVWKIFQSPKIIYFVMGSPENKVVKNVFSGLDLEIF